MGEGLTLKEPYLNEILNVDGELRLQNIRNRKKVEIGDLDLDGDPGRG